MLSRAPYGLLGQAVFALFWDGLAASKAATTLLHSSTLAWLWCPCVAFPAAAPAPPPCGLVPLEGAWGAHASASMYSWRTYCWAQWISTSLYTLCPFGLRWIPSWYCGDEGQGRVRACLCGVGKRLEGWLLKGREKTGVARTTSMRGWAWGLRLGLHKDVGREAPTKPTKSADLSSGCAISLRKHV